MASARRADRSNTARPMMLWPEARRSPSVGIVGATPTPSADTHATGRPPLRRGGAGSADFAIRPVLAPCGRETIAPVATRGPGSHESQTTCALHATRPAMALNAGAEDDFAVHHPGVDVGPNAVQKA